MRVAKYLLLSLVKFYKPIESLCQTIWPKHSELQLNISFSPVTLYPKNYLLDRYVYNIRFHFSSVHNSKRVGMQYWLALL